MNIAGFERSFAKLHLICLIAEFHETRRFSKRLLQPGRWKIYPKTR